MKWLLRFLIPVLLIVSCQKEKNSGQPPVAHPAIRYTELNNVSVKFGQQKSLDIDGDLVNELLFSNMLVADPIGKVDKRRYFVNGAFEVFSLVNELEQTPALNNGEAITIQNPPGYNWYNASSLVLVEKIIGEMGPDRWEGNWRNAEHQFLAVQIRKDNLRYNGWVELSFKMDTEELILHRAAIAIEAGKAIKAGR